MPHLKREREIKIDWLIDWTLFLNGKDISTKADSRERERERKKELELHAGVNNITREQFKIHIFSHTRRPATGYQKHSPPFTLRKYNNAIDRFSARANFCPRFSRQTEAASVAPSTRSDMGSEKDPPRKEKVDQDWQHTISSRWPSPLGGK